MSTPERGRAATWEYLALWDHGAIDTEATLEALPSTERRAAELIKAERYGGLFYAVASATWYIWDGHYLRPDDGGRIHGLLIDFGRRLARMLDSAREQVYLESDIEHQGMTEPAQQQARERSWEPWKKAVALAAALEKNAGIVALEGMLSKLCSVPDAYLAERAPGWLNTASGTTDLATRNVKAHDPGDLLTYCLETPFDPAAQCPRFWELVWRMCGRDYEVAAYVIKCLGYSMLGDNREQKVFFIAGPTGSGKSVMLRVVSDVLGELAHASQPELITVVRGGSGRNARTENSIRGARLITITETSQFMNIDEAQLKRLTGEAVISVNQHYAKTELKTPVTWTIWVATNQMPTLTNYDAAMRRRVIVIPGGPTVPEWEADNLLADKIIRSESRGILAMLVRGCSEYFRTGLAMPDAVREMTELYAVEQDTVAAFVADTMELGGWTPDGGIPQHQAWQTYQQWATGSSRLGRNEFMDKMSKYPGIMRNKSSRRFEGVAWSLDWASRVR